ncbi:hypothetical protein RB608_24845 [Nocardioides sp. LHD-245]|uniref:hypothetical protein n=1 Tax=Nocardioides sp. LHD-245 TaxID=3051387 RepID=UPI0027E153A2|nr:hypothetical protein [Nocardioides sp. LHD-245]
MTADNATIRAIRAPVLRLYCDAAGRRPRLVGVVVSVPGAGLVLRRCSGVGVLLTASVPVFGLPCRCRPRARHLVELKAVLALVRAGSRSARVAPDGTLLGRLDLDHRSTRDAPAVRPAVQRTCAAQQLPQEC